MELLCSPSIALRNARPEDAAQICELGRSVFTATFGDVIGKDALQIYLDEAYNVPTITLHITNPSQDFIVATTTASPSSSEEEGKVIGFAVLAHGNTYTCLSHLPPSEIIELSRIYIYPEFHGKGVGRMLMGELDGRARKEGKKWMWLGCYVGNERAKGVYEKAGYERVGERSCKVGEEVHWDMVMVKGL